MDENEKIEHEVVSVRSEVVQEIMSKVPHLLIRWGNTIILFLTFGVLVFSYNIHYPIILRGQAEMTTKKDSTKIYSPISGMLTGFKIKNGNLINKGASIAQIISSDGKSLELISPNSGRLYSTSFFGDSNKVNKGNLLFRIVPTDSFEYQVIVKVPTHAINRIELGQEVRVRFSNNKTQQNVIIGSIAQVSQVADENGLVAIQVLFPNRKPIKNDKDFRYILGMKGVAEIIVENPRLINHFFLQLRNIFKS